MQIFFPTVCFCSVFACFLSREAGLNFSLYLILEFCLHLQLTKFAFII